jgi:hypothetical protein
VRQSAALGITALLSAWLVSAAGAAFDARPPLAHTAGFGEPSCRECHFDGPERPASALSLGGVPERYQRGATYRLEITIRDSTAKVGGFQLAARVAAGPHAGTQAGTLCAVDSRVAVVADSTTGVQYASHALAAGADSLRWQIEWRAPTADVGAVVFHVAANSANDDDSQFGDAIILMNRESRPEAKGSGIRSQGSGGVRREVSGGVAASSCDQSPHHP